MRRLALLALLVVCAACARPPSPGRRVIVLGIDGMDPGLLTRFMADGTTPHLAALARRGVFLPLATTSPPQSPVAWSTVTTGAGPEVHGIFDFVHRDLRTLAPMLSIARVSEARHVLTLGRFALPLGGGRAERLRRGAAFWEVLAAAGVPATVLKMPANFPVDERGRSRTLAGMGTPDLLGTYGTFQVATDDPDLLGRPLRGGITHRLDFGGGLARTTLTGPPDPFSAARTPLTVPLAVAADAARGVALVRVGDEHRILRPGEWSDWVPLRFSPALGRAMPGMVRLFLKAVRPHVVVYVSPVNLDPLAPALPLASPPGYAAELARAVGRFHTLGMPEDTKGLAAGILGPADFIAQVEGLLGESERLARHELARTPRGLFFAYFSELDETSHVFYRSLDPDAAPPARAHARVIPDLYARLDRFVGEVVAAAGPDALVLVMSDHGFAPFTHKVNLNSWLARRGYLAVHGAGAARPGALGHLDWSRTQAYALGLNGLYLNLKGREPEGVVPPAERGEIVERLRRELEGFVDPDTGAPVIVSARPPAAGADPQRAPDLVVGYARGYRVSDESAVGTVAEAVIEPNRDVWSGDHCMDPDVVPGVLVSSHPLGATRAHLADLAPTILRRLGVPPPPQMTGQDLAPKEAPR